MLIKQKQISKLFEIRLNKYNKKNLHLRTVVYHNKFPMRARARKKKTLTIIKKTNISMNMPVR